VSNETLDPRFRFRLSRRMKTVRHLRSICNASTLGGYEHVPARFSASAGFADRYSHVAAMSRLSRKECTATDPEFCEGPEILLITVSNCVFLPAFNAETILSR